GVEAGGLFGRGEYLPVHLPVAGRSGSHSGRAGPGGGPLAQCLGAARRVGLATGAGISAFRSGAPGPGGERLLAFGRAVCGQPGGMLVGGPARHGGRERTPLAPAVGIAAAGFAGRVRRGGGRCDDDALRPAVAGLAPGVTDEEEMSYDWFASTL